jgi:hypothetical protein
MNDNVEPGDHITATVKLTGNNQYQITVPRQHQGLEPRIPL